MGQEEKLENSMEAYKNIRECLSGLNEIMKMSLPEKNLFRQLAMDNLENLHKNVLEVLRSAFSPREVRIQLRELEADQKEAEEVFPF
ncbi:MAG: hypothetical protein ACXADU_18720 [Promethearchaeota archaeon]|jgi:hypothetical protein